MGDIATANLAERRNGGDLGNRVWYLHDRLWSVEG
jgi:hypothetical protein